MSKIIVLGNCTLDVIFSVDHYPRENEEMRAHTMHTARGGNAANVASILAQLGHQVEFVGTLADDAHAQTIKTDLQQQRINTRYCQHIARSSSPLSSITINERTGSRTIVHYRNLPELDARSINIPWEEYDWFHIEGRAVTQMRELLQQIHARRCDQAISIEIEKNREDIDTLFPLADVLLFSREFTRQRGFANARELFEHVRRDGITALLICAWGEDGAYGRDASDNDIHVPAQAPTRIIDTLGAGDTFNAAVIDALCSGRDLAHAIKQGCRLAGIKIGKQGLHSLVNDAC